MTNRVNCTICGHNELDDVFQIKDFPVFMGATTKTPDKYVFNDLNYCKCNKCNNLQIKKLIPLDVLYQDNHNVDVVGKTWEEHNNEFAKFISKHKPRIVMEIGSPSAKIFKKIQNEEWLTKWYSIEPNPNKTTDLNDKFSIVDTFIDDTFKLEKYNIMLPNAVVMSHVFEHFYEPNKILNYLYELLNLGTDIFISIPNMTYIAKNKLMPPCGLHFEHSYYIDLENIKFILHQMGFMIAESYNFKNHSIFIRATKIETRNIISVDENLKKNNYKILSQFNETIQNCKEIVKTANDKIKGFNGEIYLYGSHFPAQLLYLLGLEINNIIGCLDQSESKIGKTLYGTNLKVYHPKVLKNKGESLVICHMGPYTNEIKNTILDINNKVIFI